MTIKTKPTKNNKKKTAAGEKGKGVEGENNNGALEPEGTKHSHCPRQKAQMRVSCNHVEAYGSLTRNE